MLLEPLVVRPKLALGNERARSNRSPEERSAKHLWCGRAEPLVLLPEREHLREEARGGVAEGYDERAVRVLVELDLGDSVPVRAEPC